MVRNINRLSFEEISTKIKPGNYADGGGLYLQVSHFKTKSWIFRFTLNKISREMGLGSLNTITLPKARLKAEKCRKQLREGIDPINSRREKLLARNLKSKKVLNLEREQNREKKLNKIVSAIRDELDPNNMLNAAVLKTTHVLDIAGCRIYRRNNDDEFCTAAEFGNTKEVEFLDFKLATFSESEKFVNLDIGNLKFLVAATNYRKRINGAVCVWRDSNRKPWDEDHYLLIKDVANQLGIANEQISNHERILALSRTDSLTGLLNRRAFYEEDLPRRILRLQRNRQLAALFFVDMDNFKMVNDVHGHQAGDDALLVLRDLLMDISRPGDVIARLGGDEFAMWLDGISPEVTKRRADDLIKGSKCLKKFSGNKDYPLGISVGVAIFNPDNKETLEELVARADDAMYQVKKADKQGFHFVDFS